MFTTNDHLALQRWLLDNGFINDLHKDNLFAYGSLVHKDVKAVEADIDVANKTINYNIFVDSDLISKIEKFKELSGAKSIINLWRFRNLVRKEGNLDFHSVLNKFVKDYCGKDWKAEVAVINVKDYEDGFKQKSENGDRADQRADQ